MPNILPGALFPGYETKLAGEAVTADSIVIPLAALPALSVAEADAVAGDGREVKRAIDDTSTNRFQALPDNQKPTSMTLTRGNSTNAPNGATRQPYSSSYTVINDQSAAILVAEA